MRALRSFLLTIAFLLGVAAMAQRVSGEWASPDRPRVLYMFATRGHDRILTDSAVVDARGRFTFTANDFPRGFYQIARADSDRVDVIIEPAEKELKVRFDGIPLQEHISIVASEVNQRLWEYKRAGRDASHTMALLRERQAKADPRDTNELRAIDALMVECIKRRTSVLDRMISADSASYFAKVVLADQRLSAAIPQGTLVIRWAMDWTDPDLLHCAVYPNAIMAVLQSATPATADVLEQASDSLLAWSSGNEECWRYVRSFLLDMFVQYSADAVVQHMVDTYVLGTGALYPPEPKILALVAAQLKVSLGSPAPDIDLPLPGRSDTLKLHQFIEQNTYVVLFFYSSTCDHCHDQMPGLMSLYRDLRPQGVEVIGIALDDNADDFDQNIRERGLLFPCYTELKAWGSPAAKAFAVTATPTFILLDNKGRIRAKPYDVIELRDTLSKLPF